MSHFCSCCQLFKWRFRKARIITITIPTNVELLCETMSAIVCNHPATNAAQLRDLPSNKLTRMLHVRHGFAVD